MIRSFGLFIILQSFVSSPAHAVFKNLLRACGIALGAPPDTTPVAKSKSSPSTSVDMNTHIPTIAAARGGDILGIDASRNINELARVESATLEALSPDAGRLVFKDGGQAKGKREEALIAELSAQLKPESVAEVTKRFSRLPNNMKIESLLSALVKQNKATRENPYTLVIQDFVPNKDDQGRYTDDLANLMRSIYNSKSEEEEWNSLRIVMSSRYPRSDWGSAQGGFNVGTPINL